MDRVHRNTKNNNRRRSIKYKILNHLISSKKSTRSAPVASFRKFPKWTPKSPILATGPAPLVCDLIWVPEIPVFRVFGSRTRKSRFWGPGPVPDRSRSRTGSGPVPDRSRIGPGSGGPGPVLDRSRTGPGTGGPGPVPGVPDWGSRTGPGPVPDRSRTPKSRISGPGPGKPGFRARTPKTRFPRDVPPYQRLFNRRGY